MVIMLLGFLNKCVSVCTSRKVPMTVKWEADFHPKSLSFSPTPPLGFVLIPSPALLLSHLLSILKCMCQLVCVCRAKGMHSAPLSLLHSKFTPSCPYSQCQFLPCSFVDVCSAGLYKGTTRFGSSPCSLCHLKSQRYTPLAASSQPKASFFFKAWETVALALALVNPC